MNINEGMVIAGRYRIFSKLGQGAMGSVYGAHDERLERDVAIKFMVAEALRDPKLRKRFLREAQTTSKLSSPHAVQVYDRAELSDGTPYIVMEFLHGATLDSVLSRTGEGVALEQAVFCVIAVCDALAEAHAIGIVHRDIKPGNVFLDEKKGVKVLDFGIAKYATAASISGTKLTHVGLSLGTPLYMSPEQFDGQGEVDARADIWSLGVMLYEMLTGRTPFDAPTLAELKRRVQQENPPSLKKMLPQVTGELENIVCRCLSKNREDRYRSAAELASALGKLEMNNGMESTCIAEFPISFRRDHKDGGVVAATLRSPLPAFETVPATDLCLPSNARMPNPVEILAMTPSKNVSGAGRMPWKAELAYRALLVLVAAALELIFYFTQPHQGRNTVLNGTVALLVGAAFGPLPSRKGKRSKQTSSPSEGSSATFELSVRPGTVIGALLVGIFSWVGLTLIPPRVSSAIPEPSGSSPSPPPPPSVIPAPSTSPPPHLPLPKGTIRDQHGNPILEAKVLVIGTNCSTTTMSPGGYFEFGECPGIASLREIQVTIHPTNCHLPCAVRLFPGPASNDVRLMIASGRCIPIGSVPASQSTRTTTTTRTAVMTNVSSDLDSAPPNWADRPTPSAQPQPLRRDP